MSARMHQGRTRGFHRALGAYLAQNHGLLTRSGKLTRRQARRLRKKYPAEMRERRSAYSGMSVKVQRSWV